MLLKASETANLWRKDAKLGDGVMPSNTCAFRTEAQISKMDQPARLAESVRAVQAHLRG
jgi:hypothetical protein